MAKCDISYKNVPCSAAFIESYKNVPALGRSNFMLF